ncbi:hypothetical protein THIOSC13_1350083 [uncultured Thiomicrorhabdus sp.]
MSGKVQQTSQMGRDSGFSSSSKVNETGYAVGDRVSHAKFGDGIVLNYEGSGEHARIQVNFTNSVPNG